MTAYAFLAGVVLLLLAGAVGYLVGRGAATRDAVDPATVDAVRRESQSLRALVHRLKDIAWDNREIDPALSTIVIDEIRTFEKRELE